MEGVRDNNPPRTSLRIVKGADRPATEPDRPCLTIADVAKACGLPQPVIAQVVPRTWTAKGWMYTNAQLQEAVEIAMAWPRPDDEDRTVHPRGFRRQTRECSGDDPD